MKKIIVVLLVFVSASLYGGDLISGHVEAGYINFDYLWGDDSGATGTADPLTYIDLSVRADYLFLFIGGRVVNYQFMRDVKKFDVLLTDYTVYCGFQFEILDTPIEIGFRHSCGHPVISGRDPLMSINRAYEQIFLRAEF